MKFTARLSTLITASFAAAGAFSPAVLAATPEAQLAPAADATPAANETLATPPMWRVSDDDSDFILLGTFHILPPALQWRTDGLEAAIGAADTVYFELDATAPQTQSVATRIVMLEGFNADGAKLTDILEPGDAQLLTSITQSLGLPLAGVNPMRPWNAFLTLSVQFIVSQGFQPGAGVDSVLLAETRTLGKDLVFFETVEEQLSFFTDLAPEIEKSLLVLTLRDWENQKAGFDPLYNAWRTGNVSEIDTLMNDAMREQAPEVFDLLIIQRNNAWADVLENDIKNGAGTALVAVGAGHLTDGDDSLPALLAARGFTVTRYGIGDAPVLGDAANDNAAPAE